MTTITLTDAPHLRKTHFRDLVELRDFVVSEIENAESLDFRPLRRNEVSKEVKEKHARARRMSKLQFVNLSRQHAC